MTHPLILLENVQVGYSSAQSLIPQPLSLKATSGQLIALLGRNGTGKSTLLKTLCGLLAPLSGKVSLGHNDITTLKPQQLAKQISYVTARRVSTPQLTVTELVQMGRHPHTGSWGRFKNQDHQMVEQAIRDVGITELAHRQCNQLSDGELQLAWIASALAQEASIILLDEPTSHLDMVHKGEVMDLLHHIAKNQNKCILLSSHDLYLCEQHADLFWILNPLHKPGVSLLEGAPQDPYIQEALDAYKNPKSQKVRPHES